jgi:uncharacterized protein YbjT (DUF2867 family)
MSALKTILVAGASGKLGHCIVTELKRRGYLVHILSRQPERLNKLHAGADAIIRGDLLGNLAGVCNGADAVISCAGANMNMNDFRNKTSFYDVDYRGNLRLLEEATKAGVKKFVYVSAFGAQTLDSEYTNAHEQFVAALEGSELACTVVRPTGFFSFMGEFVTMAKRGAGMVIGSGNNCTNPIHEADVADICVAALEGDEHEIDCGGPEIFTRREIVEMAFRAVGKPSRVIALPKGAYNLFPLLIKPFNPRIAALLDFGGKVATQDCIAPQRGSHRIEEYFVSIAGENKK